MSVRRILTTATALGALATAPMAVAQTGGAPDAAADHRPSGLYGDPVRVATFNASLNRSAAGELIEDLSTPDDAQAQRIAAIIQHVRPEILLLNEFDYDADGQALQLFLDNYLAVGQHGQQPISYPYSFAAPSNTGVPSGHDLDNDGEVGGPGDAFGFGFYPGQFGMALLSQHRILEGQVRTFQEFRWADMPGALLPDDPETPEPHDWYSEEELADVRLSSKSHWDVPIDVGSWEPLHILAAHPTPPVFDDPVIDQNGRRNHDEIRFWADYLRPARSLYITDDQGRHGGLWWALPFVIVGDYNADPCDGDSFDDAIRQLLGHPRTRQWPAPTSVGAILDARQDGGINADHDCPARRDTADFGDENPGNLRVDYVLPARIVRIADNGVFWPTDDHPLADVVGDDQPVWDQASDHRLVWADLEVPLPRRR